MENLLLILESTCWTSIILGCRTAIVETLFQKGKLLTGWNHGLILIIKEGSPYLTINRQGEREAEKTTPNFFVFPQVFV